MRQGGVAERWAEAVLGAARDRGAVDAVAADLAALRQLAERDPELGRVLESPQVREDHRHRVVDALFGKRVDVLTLRFLHLLLDKKRAAYLADVARAYADLLDRERGVIRATVTTARPLTAAERERLRAALAARTGRPVQLEPRVDREVLGGVVVQYGDQILDDTVRTRLGEIRDALLGARAEAAG
jgi:F-type H+-transporting ATPase subunit delta